MSIRGLELPAITQISPQVLEGRPRGEIMLRGLNLDKATAVEVGGIIARIRVATSTVIVLELPDGLGAGLVTVVAVREVELGQPPVRHELYRSSPASFVLRPRLLAPPVYEARGSRIVVEVAPEVREGQRLALLLNRLAERPEGLTLAGEPGGSGSRCRFAAEGVASGSYLVRVSVGSVQSALEVDHDPQSPTYEQFVGPRLEIP